MESKEQTELTRKMGTHSWIQTDSCQRGGRLRKWAKKVKGLGKNKFIDADNSMVIARRKGGEVVGGATVMEGDETWGGGHTRQCADGVLWNCTPETYVTLLTNATPINSTETQNNGLYTTGSIPKR